ncbi:uncharacterized protein MELLADRAFT_87126 [Melampsora larici-populina 98AG31]|uniref:Uncharacterized protein n=1 Tax=Melampsora larici-populina (strain 98AG31 / pathotype 3-4-7) TaxID=747676 RepID=F4R4L6_MELLP|nr:uncharacterized protein MELLADRAFT_87126 [Melampsora larici-populina 98AG31]EGG12830.1 hypothetical protein MELLADRAFT_87126 [Melampsora larici-populina 98AG31]
MMTVRPPAFTEFLGRKFLGIKTTGSSPIKRLPTPLTRSLRRKYTVKLQVLTRTIYTQTTYKKFQGFSTVLGEDFSGRQQFLANTLLGQSPFTPFTGFSKKTYTGRYSFITRTLFGTGSVDVTTTPALDHPSLTSQETDINISPPVGDNSTPPLDPLDTLIIPESPEDQGNITPGQPLDVSADTSTPGDFVQPTTSEVDTTVTQSVENITTVINTSEVVPPKSPSTQPTSPAPDIVQNTNNSTQSNQDTTLPQSGDNSTSDTNTSQNVQSEPRPDQPATPVPDVVQDPDNSTQSSQDAAVTQPVGSEILVTSTSEIAQSDSQSVQPTPPVTDVVEDPNNSTQSND